MEQSVSSVKHKMQQFVLDVIGRRAHAWYMLLRDYLAKNGGPNALAERLNVTSAAVRLWASGRRIPTKDYMLAIVKATRGAVQPNDFYRGS